MKEDVPDLSLKELKVCRKAFNEYCSMFPDRLIVDPRPGGGPKLLRNFVDVMTQARWCAWLEGWKTQAARKVK
jgi:hypothetical protein